MIVDHEAFFLGEDGEHQFLFEVNWDKSNSATNECKLVRVTYPAKPKENETQYVTYIKREHLNSMLFAMGNEEEQRKMVPYRQQIVRTIETTLGIKAKKDIKKGEMINVPVKLDIPLDMREKIGFEREKFAKQNEKKSGIIVPK